MHSGFIRARQKKCCFASSRPARLNTDENVIPETVLRRWVWHQSFNGWITQPSHGCASLWAGNGSAGLGQANAGQSEAEIVPGCKNPSFQGMKSLRKVLASPPKLGQQFHGQRHHAASMQRSLRAGFPTLPVTAPRPARPLVRPDQGHRKRLI